MFIIKYLYSYKRVPSLFLLVFIFIVTFDSYHTLYDENMITYLIGCLNNKKTSNENADYLLK